jgi:4-carboxymuconolactone decarboxylase
LLVEHNPAAQMHALAARRAGASWEELHKVVELASATGSLGPANRGGAMLKELRDKEDGA